jgi:uncharacterized protein
MLPKRNYLWPEFLIAFGGIPLLVCEVRIRAVMFSLLWIGALLGLHTLKHQNPEFRYHAEWNTAGARAGIKSVLRRFIMMAILLTSFTIIHDFDRLFSFPLERPSMWLLVMFLYPLLSVWPQEIAYRTFFLQRYEPIFKMHTTLASALAFGYAHIVFGNWIAIVFCTCGGWLFADTYRRHRSLALVCVEHALYGCLIFTLGLGWYFYGAAWQR